MSIDPFMNKELKIAVIGGGTGSFTLLSALKFKTPQLVALVNMADNRTLYAKIYFSASYILRGSLSKLRKGKNKRFFVKK